ncbi:MarR family winged helix-turn-helix transcriptional regulator [Hyphococcus sp.]|uniref:MarR family winged helix-turn-helix transcriptional regulator n=1 Tax=Hyphococcus sp. TaxID=2038636 RepID=UPI0035C6B4DB
MREYEEKAEAGLPGDPVLFKVLTEISIISNLADREFERLMPGGLTLAQFGVLNHLLRLGVQQTIGEIASAMTVAQPTMSSTVKKLVDKHYVELVPDTDDRRVKRVKVIRAGRTARDRAVKAVAPGLAMLKEGTPGADWNALLGELTRLRIVIDSKV